MSAVHIHVRATSAGTWLVEPDDRDAPLSEHATATEAERAALRHADDYDAARVLLRDRYQRLREVPLRRSGALRRV